jgi:hypothetical protein
MFHLQPKPTERDVSSPPGSGKASFYMVCARLENCSWTTELQLTSKATFAACVKLDGQICFHDIGGGYGQNSRKAR